MEIIAEIGQNHNGDMALAAELVRAAKRNGADVAKFQVYDAKRLFPREDNPWYEYNCATELTRDALGFLADECAKVGIEFMASVFDVERIGWLEQVGVRRYKVASRSIHDRELIDALRATGKPLLISLGMWKERQFPQVEHTAAVDYLYCVSKYPTPIADLSLRQVDFNRYAGFSDHTIGVSASIAAFVWGARILEKHFTLDKSSYGPDHTCSMTPEELKAIDTFRRDLERM